MEYLLRFKSSNEEEFERLLNDYHKAKKALSGFISDERLYPVLKENEGEGPTAATDDPKLIDTF